MDDKDDRLSKEELQYLIEELNLPDDEIADKVENPLKSSTHSGAVQTDLKMRLQRAIEEMRQRNEEVPAPLLELMQRL